jgi:hypothetical protein
MACIYRLALTCDGCGVTFGSEHYENALTARATAYAAGWRFPSRVKEDGQPTKAETNDVCPACQSDWQPRPARRPGDRR